MRVTHKTLKALKILADRSEGVTPSQFADLMWPDSPYHRVAYQCGPKGSCKGRGLVMSAGGYLGRLSKRGLIEFRHRWVAGRPYGRVYSISQAGKDALGAQGTLSLQEEK